MACKVTSGGEGENYYGVTAWFIEGQERAGKPYEERSGRKLLLDVARTPDTGLSVPFPTTGVESRASDSRRWDRSSSAQNIVQNEETVNKENRLKGTDRKEKARILESGGRRLPHFPPDQTAGGKPESLSGSQTQETGTGNILPPYPEKVNEGQREGQEIKAENRGLFDRTANSDYSESGGPYERTERTSPADVEAAEDQTQSKEVREKNRRIREEIREDLDRLLRRQFLSKEPETRDLHRLTPSGIRTVSRSIADFVRKGWIDFRDAPVASSADLAVLAQIYRDPRVETLRIFYVKDGRIVGHEGFSSNMPGFVLIEVTACCTIILPEMSIQSHSAPSCGVIEGNVNQENEHKSLEKNKKQEVSP